MKFFNGIYFDSIKATLKILTMKTITTNTFTRIFAFVLTLFSGILLYAQDDSNTVVNETKTTTTTEWYADPMYLIGGGILLVILIALLVRGGRRTDD